MPIATCFLRRKPAETIDLQGMADKWAREIGVAIEDVCLTFVPYHGQGGQQYEALVNLYLPSLWSADQVGKIQLGLLEVLTDHFGFQSKDVFIITSIVQSGHVVENGKIVKWE